MSRKAQNPGRQCQWDVSGIPEDFRWFCQCRNSHYGDQRRSQSSCVPSGNANADKIHMESLYETLSPNIMRHGTDYTKSCFSSLITRNMGPTWVLSSPGGPRVGPWTLLSGILSAVSTKCAVKNPTQKWKGGHVDRFVIIGCTSAGAANDDKFVNMTTFLFKWIINGQAPHSINSVHWSTVKVIY